jgi:hypothetical protein
MNIILVENKRMENPSTILVSIQDRLEGLNIARWAVGLRNQKSLTDGPITLGGKKK